VSTASNVEDHEGVDRAAHRLVTLLTARGETLAAAESLTAGLLCATVATVPGASAVLRGGVVTYATDVKALLADVPENVLDTYGPVAELTARYMALGAANRVVADWGVSLTGVAGPTMQDGHPVGEVWCGVRPPGAQSIEDVTAVKLPVDPTGSRSQIRRQAVELALELLIRNVNVD
jgi:nicotinamide-nucleotide amidase